MASLVVVGVGVVAPPPLKQMADRGFHEAELCLMLEEPSGYHRDVERGRWAVETRHAGGLWEVILEPIPREEVLLVVTAYPLG